MRPISFIIIKIYFNESETCIIKQYLQFEKDQI